MSDESKGGERGDAGASWSEGATAREAERGDVAEPDAPTAAEENDSMGMILDADPLLGVQDDAGDE
jgi:hypothetical protein